MLSIGKLAAGQAKYYLGQAEVRVDTVQSIGEGVEEYYAAGAEARGVWVGRAAAALGLSGAVDGDALRRILSGLDPRDGSPLRDSSSPVRVAGFDLTHWAARLAIARGFAAFLQTIDPATEIPAADVFAVRYQRPTPYLWSKQEVRRLLQAARTLRPPLKAVSYEALFGLLAVSGMRVGEVVALECGDVDLQRGVVTIREQTAKLERARLVPLHSTTVDALGRYATTRERLCSQPKSNAFFLSGAGTRIDRSDVSKTLRTITTELGLRTATIKPRAHDLRHSFAVTTLVGWQRSGEQIDARIAALSTYLGHASPADTYWYLTATPELMGLAAQRLDQRFGGQA